MRKARDGETTKEVVTAAAREVFAERGFAGTSLALISERSGISVGLILHHFGSKRNLYHVVLESLAREYGAAIAQAGEGLADPKQAMQQQLRAAFEYWSKDTSYNRISLWAYLENQTELVEEEVKLTAGMAEVIRQMQAQGWVNPAVAPFVLLSMTLGPIHFWTRYRDLFKEALHLSESREELDRMFLEQALGLIQKLYRVEDIDQ